MNKKNNLLLRSSQIKALNKSSNGTQGAQYSNIGKPIVKAKLTNSSRELNINISSYKDFIYNIPRSDNQLISLYDLQEYNRSNSSFQKLYLFIAFSNKDIEMCTQPFSYFDSKCRYTYSKNNNIIKIQNSNNIYLEFEIIN
jgi:hypothetical protein